MSEAKLSSRGQWHRSPHKKYQETVLLVPFFGAEKKNLQRHAEFLNELGFDCVVFDLHDDWGQLAHNFLSSKMQFGLKHIWADQIEALLNEIPGNKIIFSFSNPSASAIEAIARRHAADINGLVCDGGPSGQLWSSMVNYFTHETPLPFYPLKAAIAFASASLWHPHFLKVIHEDLAQFPKGFRLLSVRGWKDPLITPKMIDMVFEPHKQLDWQKLSIPEGKHLNGLKDHPDLYVPAVRQFLKEIATPKAKTKSLPQN
jgi:hypothetical protein